jgi:hypothetical protein
MCFLNEYCTLLMHQLSGYIRGPILTRFNSLVFDLNFQLWLIFFLPDSGIKLIQIFAAFL